MKQIEEALKRWRQDAGPLPADMAGASHWSQPGEVPAPATGAPFDPFPNEAATPFRREAEPAAARPVAPSTPVPPRARYESEAGAAPVLAAPTSPPASIAAFSGFNGRVAGKIVSGPKIDPGSIEQYGRLAAALHHAQLERGIKKAMVTSAVAREGKTLTALNVALTLSESYRRRVVLVDADLRCSSVHTLLNVANVAGLSEALKDTRQISATVLPISPRLSVLLAGRSRTDPMGALTSPRMAQILDDASANFDWVIVDTPPVVLLPDTNLLARMVDVAIVVVQAGRTAYDLVERAVEAVERERVLGVVLNNVEDPAALTYYYSVPVTP